MTTKLYRHYCFPDAAFGGSPSAEGLSVYHTGGIATPVAGISRAPGSAVEFYSPEELNDYNLYRTEAVAALAAGDVIRASFWYRWSVQGANGHFAINWPGISQAESFMMGTSADPAGTHSLDSMGDDFTYNTAEFVLPPGRWHWVEMETLIDPAAGWAKLWVDGVLRASLSGLRMTERIGRTSINFGMGGSSSEAGTRFAMDEVTFSVNDARAFAGHAPSPRIPNSVSPGGRILCPRRVANKVT